MSMDLVAIRKRDIAWTIQQNPTEITIQRTVKVDRGGYFEEETNEVGPFTVRIFLKGSQLPQEVSTLAGKKQEDRGWGLLAGEDAQVMAGTNAKDEFEVPGIGRFQVVSVYPLLVRGVIVGYQADLEKVS